MTQSVSVVCPSCDAVLKISKPSLIGKKIACPACKKPVLIKAPAPASKSDEVSRKTDVALPAVTAKAGKSHHDDETILLADDDDHFVKPVVKSAAAPAPTAAPSRKPRSSAVWKKMGDTETAEFEAMLVDKEEDAAEPEMEFPLDRSSSTLNLKEEEEDSAPAESYSLPLDTSSEHDQITEEMSASRPKKRKSPSKTKSSNRRDSDEFDASTDAEAGDDDFESHAPRPPRRPLNSGSRAGRSSSAQKLPLIIGAFAGCSLLMGLLIWSISGTHAPPSLRQPTADNGSATAENQDENAATTKDDTETSRPAAAKTEVAENAAKPPKLSTTAAKRAGQGSGAANGGASGGGGADSTSPATPDPGDSSLGAKAVAANVGGLAAGTANAATSGEGSIVGRKIPAFSAAAIDNTTFQSADSKQQVLVVAFLGVECPLANLYYPRLVELANKYKEKSVGFLVVNSNAQDTLDGIQKQARINKASFPVLKDAGSAVAKLFDAERTPEVFVLDGERTVRFHGMIDDQYGYRQRRSQPTKNYVVDAVEAMLGSRAVAVAETPVQGCHIGRITKAAETAHTSFYRDVLPVLQNRCQQCHRPGEIGPFSLKDFAEARDWGPTIREAVAEHRMPPWPADPQFGKFSNDISLTDAEVETITKWVDEGCPEGNAAEKPPEKKFVDGWNIGKPDRVFSMEKPFHVPATGVIEYQNIIVSPVFAQDTWVQAVECRFGNRTVVHHMLVLLDFPKDHSKSQDGLVKGFFAAGAPGSTYFTFPKGYAKRIPKGARLRFQMHYTPNGSATEDQSKFGIVLAKSKEREVQTYALGKVDFNIPAGRADHMERAEQNVNADVTLTTLMPHMHVRGKSFKFTVVWPDGKEETLLSVPRWDFNWQPQYQLVKPVVLTKGSKIIVEAHWDNSPDNPNNILPPVDVQFGEQTFDEMFIGYVNFIPKAMVDASRTRGHKRGG
jgi:peroxiredoxin